MRIFRSVAQWESIALTSQGSGVQSPSLLFQHLGWYMRKIFYFIFLAILFTNHLYANDDQLAKILNREKELIQMEKDLQIEMNNRKTSILNNANECLSRAKTKKEIRECNKVKNDELAFLQKEMKFRKEQIANERKDLAEQKKNLKKPRKKRKF